MEKGKNMQTWIITPHLVNVRKKSRRRQKNVGNSLISNTIIIVPYKSTKKLRDN